MRRHVIKSTKQPICKFAFICIFLALSLGAYSPRKSVSAIKFYDSSGNRIKKGNDTYETNQNNDYNFNAVYDSVHETLSQKRSRFPCPGDSTGLTKAVLSKQIENVKSLLDQGIKPDQRDKNCYTPLIWAASNGDYEIVKLLLDSGADINAFNRDGHTALTFTVLNIGLVLNEGRHIDVIELLIERGADINWKSKMEGTPLKIAEDFDLKEVGEILKKAGAKK